MIASGAIVRINRHDDIAWVVQGRTLEGRWRCVSKAIDGSNGSAFGSITAGVGDIVVVKGAPSYEVGAAVTYHGLAHTVAADLGEFVELTVPESRHPLRGGGHVSIPAGNKTIVAKSDLVLEALT